MGIAWKISEKWKGAGGILSFTFTITFTKSGRRNSKSGKSFAEDSSLAPAELVPLHTPRPLRDPFQEGALGAHAPAQWPPPIRKSASRGVGYPLTRRDWVLALLEDEGKERLRTTGCRLQGRPIYYLLGPICFFLLRKKKTASKSVFGGLILDGAESAYFLGARVAGHSGSSLSLFVRGEDEAVE